MQGIITTETLNLLMVKSNWGTSAHGSQLDDLSEKSHCVILYLKGQLKDKHSFSGKCYETLISCDYPNQCLYIYNLYNIPEHHFF